jgi:hypothetical protein
MIEIIISRLSTSPGTPGPHGLAVRKALFVRAKNSRAQHFAPTASRDPRFVMIGRNAPQSWRETTYVNQNILKSVS